ncbi:MAG: hypothetical protein RL885_20090 [Planctomycetota bacterium]
MIRINLLPDELRRADRTSPQVFVTLLVGVTLVCSAGAFFAKMRFGTLEQALAEKDQVNLQWNQVKGHAQHADNLTAEMQDYNRRHDTIQKIGNSRILWTRKLDQLVSIVDNHGDTDRHWIWLDSLRATAGTDKGGGSLVLAGFSGTSELSRLSNFHEDLLGGDFFGDFVSIDNPGGSVQKFPGLYPDAAWQFNYTLHLKNPEASKKPGPKKR